MWSCLGVCMLQQLAIFTHLFSWVIFHCGASLVAQMINNLLEMQETQLPSLGREDSMERKWLPTPVFFPGESHGHRSLAVYCPWAPKELDITEWLTTHTYNIPLYMCNNFFLHSTLDGYFPCFCMLGVLIDAVHEIFQARILEWVASHFSRGSSLPRGWTWVSAFQADSLSSDPSAWF